MIKQLKNGRTLAYKFFILLLLSGISSIPAVGQNLDFNTKETIPLNDGTIITLYAQLTGSGSTAKPSKNYFYLPTQIMLSKYPVSKVPDFLFLKYVTNEREDQGGVNGALMHFLMQTGFTQTQLSEVQAKLDARVSGAKVKGPVDLFGAEDAQSFTITSAVVNKEGGMTKSLVTSGRAPLYQGGKVAVATNLNKYGAQLMAATFEKANSITDLSVNLLYKYYLKVTGLSGKITVDYEKMSKMIKEDKVTAEYRRVESKNSVQESQSWNEFHSLYNKMVENSVITQEINEGPVSNATSEKLTEMFFQLFMSKFTTPATDQPPPPPSEKEKEYLPGKNSAYGYYLNVKRIEQSLVKKKEVITINYTFSLPMELSITQNLKTFYNSAKDNKNCVASVLLDDNFYKHMDIRFQVGSDVLKMFDMNEVDLVTVDVLKKRNSGNHFTSTISFTKDDIAKKGSVAGITYASGDDKNAEMYQYRTQWSMKGGIKFPQNPQYVVGSMQASTLDLPITAHKIEFEADPEKLKELGISRAIMQVRYSKFGEEIEENISVSPAKNEPISSKTIFIDKAVRGYAYRMIFYHTTEGKLALPWSPKVSGSGSESYEYAVIPEELANKSSDLFIKAIDMAKAIITPGPDGKVSKDKVLDGFKDILGAVKN